MVGWLVLVALFVGASYAKFYHNHTHLPEGCDEFGYLNLAEAIRSGKAFDNHAERSFLTDLITDLERNGFTYEEYGWILAPHAYHCQPDKALITNQYPPGTSFLLSAFPLEDRQPAFPALVVLLFCLLPLVALYLLDPRALTAGHVLLVALLVFSLASVPFLTEYARINSVAPTWGILLASGILLVRKPGWALALIATSCLFRVSNGWLFIPVGLVYIAHHWKASWGKRILRGWGAFVLVLVGGLGILMWYQYALLGDPLATTYSVRDQTWVSGTGIFNNLYFYVVEEPGWLWVHVVGILGLILLKWRNHLSSKHILGWLGLIAFNYSFFLAHKVTVPYYPYASAMLLWGALIYYTSAIRIPLKAERYAWLFLVGLAIGLLVTSIDTDTKAQQLTEQRSLEACLTETDVVWAELRSGTVEYASGKAGLRFIWGERPVRDFIIHWFFTHGIDQTFWVSDLPGHETDIRQTFVRLNLPYRLRNCPEWGTFVHVEAP